MVDNAVAKNHRDAGESAADSLAAGLAGASVLMAVWAALGVALIALLARAKQSHPRAIDRAAAAAVSTHTIPTQPAPEARPHPPAAPAASVT